MKQARGNGLRVRYVQGDRDGKFGNAFDAALRRHRVEAVPSPPQAPNTQAFIERFIGSIRRECLNHFVFFGVNHLDTIARSWLAHYHAERPHQRLKTNCSSGRPRPRSPLPSTRQRFRSATSVAVSGSAGCSSIMNGLRPDIVAPICDRRCSSLDRRRAQSRRCSLSIHRRRCRFTHTTPEFSIVRRRFAPRIRRALIFAPDGADRARTYSAPATGGTLSCAKLKPGRSNPNAAINITPRNRSFILSPFAD